MEPDSQGMHTTDSIDYVVIVSGEVTPEPCMIVGVAIGADRLKPA